MNSYRPIHHLALTTFGLLAAGVLQAPAGTFWIEGEDATEKQTSPHGWYDSVKKDSLSGGNWLSHFSGSRPGSARFIFQADTGGDHQFWMRANHVQASLGWRINDGPWQTVDFRADQRGAVNVAADNKPDLRFLSWNKLGMVQLKPGKNTIDVRFESKASHHGAIDCLCLTDQPWAPSGIAKPDDAPQAGPDVWFPVVFDDDPLSPRSVTDLSDLVPAPAGRFGFLRKEGDHLRFEQSEVPVKFWAVGTSPGSQPVEKMAHTARWLRKHGINLVRQHTVVGDVGLLNARGEFDAARLDRYDRWFAALKAEGIHTTWSVLYPHHGPFLQKHDGYDPAKFAELDRGDRQHDGQRQAIVVNDFINLDPELQDIALRYFRQLLTHVNPYTGLAYKDDPALAFLEFQNESNVYFHTLNSLREGREYPIFSRLMRQGFFAFVKEKYGTRVAVEKAWGGRWDRFDRWDQGELGLMGAYHWGSDGPLNEFAGQSRRAGDYIEYLTRLQRGYYERREREVRALGFRGVTVTTAWKSGGPAASLANLYADTAADMIDRHNYFGGGDGGHAIQEGKVDTRTHLDQPGHGLLSLGLFQVEGQPFGVSEWSMLPPSPWKAEAAPLIAFYGMGLQGWDASYHFNCGAQRMGNGWPNLSKYVTHTPHYLGQFPALARAVHEGHFKEGKTIARRPVSLDQVFSGKDVLGQSLAGGGFDNKELVGRLSTPAEALAIGKVTVDFQSGSAIQDSLDPYWDRQERKLTSVTGELVWHYGDRRVEARSPRTQAVIGFTRDPKRPIQLPDAKLTLRTPFVSLLLTSMDQLPLSSSREILITALAREKQQGSEFSPDGSQLLKIGAPPLLLEPVQADIQLRGSRPNRVVPLDVYGVPMPGREVPIQPDGSFTIDGTYQTYHYQIQR